MEDGGVISDHVYERCPYQSGCISCISYPELCHATVSESRLCGKSKALHTTIPDNNPVDRYITKVKHEMSSMNLTYMQAVDLINFITIRARRL